MVMVLRSALKFIGLSSDEYNTHSFRIEAGTTAAMLGTNDDGITYMGRWKFHLFKRYTWTGLLKTLVNFIHWLGGTVSAG